MTRFRHAPLWLKVCFYVLLVVGIPLAMDEQWFTTHPWIAVIWAVLVGAVLVTMHILERRSHARSTRFTHSSNCRACSYDLRASKDRCPECGREIEKTEPDGSAA